jgi:hypothetical protein
MIGTTPLRTLFVIALSTLLASCFAPTTEWVKDGASAEELRYARDTCERESAGYAFVDDFRGEDSRRGQSGISSARSDTYRRCMETQGWRRERTGQAK